MGGFVFYLVMPPKFFRSLINDKSNLYQTRHITYATNSNADNIFSKLTKHNSGTNRISSIPSGSLARTVPSSHPYQTQPYTMTRPTIAPSNHTLRPPSDPQHHQQIQYNLIYTIQYCTCYCIVLYTRPAHPMLCRSPQRPLTKPRNLTSNHLIRLGTYTVYFN